MSKKAEKGKKAKNGSNRFPPFDHLLKDMKYSGALDTPIVAKVPRVHLHSRLSKEEWEARQDQFTNEGGAFLRDVHEQRLKKIDSLLEAFSIGRDDNQKWEKLALLLASKHVPGFAVHDSSMTKPPTWTIHEVSDLHRTVQEKIRATKLSSSAAILALVKNAARNPGIEHSLFCPESGTMEAINKRCRVLKNKLSETRNDPDVKQYLENERIAEEKSRKHHEPSPYFARTMVQQDLSLQDTRQQWSGFHRIGYPVFDHEYTPEEWDQVTEGAFKELHPPQKDETN